MHLPWLDTLTRNLRWQDVVDVLLLTLLFSAIYRVMRRTVALHVALGLSVLILGSWLANRFGLILTSYVLSAVSAVAAIVIVVVFQQDIRLALGRANPLRWFARRSAPLPSLVLVAEAAFAVARHGKGALIVLRRRDSLLEHTTSGTVVDARLSVPIIEAIFTSSSPLHDGAVVVNRDRLLRAGVVLPLATDGFEGAGGTRHRAAVGLARATDALIVCVSEEDGTVSLMHDESIEVMPDPAGLELALQRLGPDRARVRSAASPVRWFHALRILPYLAIFAAVATGWSLLALDRSHVIVRVVPLEMRGLGEALAFEPLWPTHVTLELRGSAHELGALPQDGIHAYIDLGRAALGSHRYRIRTESPAGIEVSSVTPPAVHLEIRPRAAPTPPAAQVHP